MIDNKDERVRMLDKKDIELQIFRLSQIIDHLQSQDIDDSHNDEKISRFQAHKSALSSLLDNML